MLIDAKTKLDELLKNYPFLLEFLAGWSSKYGKLRNPLLRTTVGKLATLDQVAAMGDVPLGKLLAAIAGEVHRATGESVLAGEIKAEGPVPAFTDRAAKKEVLKDIIRDLHRGGDVDRLKGRFAELVRDVSGSEIGVMEQELISEGLPEEEVRKLCDVHVKVFEDSLDAQPAPQTVPGHPLHTLSAENRALEKLVAEAQGVLTHLKDDPDRREWPADRVRLTSLLSSLFEIDKHFLKKENQLFPRLEAKGISGPSKVMWAVHDDIRAHLKDLRRALELGDPDLVLRTGQWVLQETTDMVTKEEKILFPMSLEMLGEADWVKVKKGEEEVGYAWIAPAPAWTPAAAVPAGTGVHATSSATGFVLDTGVLSAEQIDLMLTRLPVDISFVDESDTVVYYSATPERIFPRTPGVIGRKVQNCHPPKSVDVVERILKAFRAGERDEAGFWIESRGKFIHIRYYAMRDKTGRYRGALEVTQDVTAIRALKGERRLLDWDKQADGEV
jgi:DUF438 domain-containing protein